MGKTPGPSISQGSPTPKKSRFKMYRGRGAGRGGYNSGGRGRGGGGGGYYGGQRKKYLMEGMKGFICSCNFNEKDCIKEALNLLNEYVMPQDIPEPKGPSTAPKDPSAETVPEKDTPNPSKELEASDDDIEGALKAEIDQLKKENTQGKQNFYALHSDSQNLVFIKTNVKDPADLAHRILTDIVTKQCQKSRFLLRMLPIELTCKAYMDQLEGIAHKIFPKYFQHGNPSFQILFKARLNNTIKRDDVIKTLADIVTQINPMSVVNLKEPKYTVIVEVIKGIICLGVVTDYAKFKRYNLIEASGQPQDQGSGDKGKRIAADDKNAVVTEADAPTADDNEEMKNSEVDVKEEPTNANDNEEMKKLEVDITEQPPEPKPE